jgi:hypothetical protein
MVPRSRRIVTSFTDLLSTHPRKQYRLCKLGIMTSQISWANTPMENAHMLPSLYQGRTSLPILKSIDRRHNTVFFSVMKK